MKTRRERPSIEEATDTFGPGWQTVLFYGLSIIGALSLEFVLYRIVQSTSGWLEKVVLMLMVLFAILAYLVIDNGGKLVREREQDAAQTIRDTNARKIYEELPGGGSKDTYFLYLRPFVSTGKVKIALKSEMRLRQAQDYTNHAIPFGFVNEGQTKKPYVTWGDLETELAAALESHGQMIALGEPGEQIGSGRIQSTEETWQADFFRLAKGARLIFLLPSTRDGTKWEIGRILQDRRLRRKSIFIVPPDEDLFGDPTDMSSTYKFGSQPEVSGDAALRADAIQALRLFNLKKGAIRKIKKKPEGLMFILGKDRSIVASRKLLVYREPRISLNPTDTKEFPKTAFSEAVQKLAKYSDQEGDDE
jgi:hypothetical protein